MIHHLPFFYPVFGIIGTAAALIGSAIIGAAGSAVAANQTKKALQGAQGVADRLTYQPIDINKVKQDAADQAVTNATASLDLERRLQPDVAATRANLSKTVSDQLALGGKLPPDIANMIAQNARIAGGTSGGFGGTPGVTAGLLGTSALSLLNSRIGNANSLLAANPLPTAGLDPGSLASLEVGQNSAMNDFNAAKAGVQTNLINSQGQASAAGIGGAANSLSGLLGLYAALGAQKIPGGVTPSGTAMVPATAPVMQFNSKMPTYNASLIPGG